MQGGRSLTIRQYVEIADDGQQPGYNITSPQIAQRANDIAYAHPWIQPQTIMSLAKYNISNEAIDMVGRASAMRELGQYDSKKNTQGDLVAPVRYAFNAAGWAKKVAEATFDFVVPAAVERPLVWGFDQLINAPVRLANQYVIKPTVRWSTAILDTIPEAVQSVAANMVTSSDFDLFGLWESTSLATMLENVEDVGEGFFMSETLREEQAKRARAYRGTVYGNTFTIGRAALGWTGENSRLYKYGSGFIDAAVLLATPDPTVHIGKALYAGTKSAGAVLHAMQLGLDMNTAFKAGLTKLPTLTKADARVVRNLMRDETYVLRAEAGLQDGISGENIDAQKFIAFMQNNPVALNLVDTLIEKTNRMEILEDIFRFEIDTNVADALASATTRNQVISALAAPFTMDKGGVLTGPIGRYRVRKTGNALLKTRWFTQMPKSSIVVSGDEVDDLDALRNMVLGLRTSGVSEQVIKEWGDDAIRAFSKQGTAPERKATINAYKGAIHEILRVNGIEEEAITRLFQRQQGHIDKVRSYLVDRMGIDTDNGHLKMMIEQIGDSADSAVVAEFLARAAPYVDEASFPGPAKLADLLNRVQTLPDPRELRRLTRNPLFQKVFDVFGVRPKKLAIAGKRVSIEVERYHDPHAVRELKDELSELKKLRGSARTEAVKAEIGAIETQLTQLTYTEKVRALTGEARLAIDLLDYVQNRIWKPLNLATIGYIMRNGIDAQIRMAFGGVRSLANTTVLHPLEFIHIAVGLPGKGTKYAKSITGVDMTNLGVARKTWRGEVIAEPAARAGQYVYVGEQRFEATASGLRQAKKYAKRTGKPMFTPELEAEVMDDVTAASVVQEQLAETLGNVSLRVGWTDADEVRHRVRTGSFPVFSRRADGSYDSYMHTKGVIEQLQKARKNETTRIVARGIQQGKTNQQIAEEAADWLLANRSGPAYRAYESMYRRGIEYKADAHPGVDIDFPPFDFEQAIALGHTDQVRQKLIDHILAVDVKTGRMLTGKLPELEFAAAYNGLGDLEAAVAVPVSRIERIGAGKNTKLKPGATASLDGKVGVITKIEKVSEDAEEIVTFVPFLERYVLDGTPGKGSIGLRRLIERSPISPDDVAPGLPIRVASEQLLTDPRRFKTDQQKLASIADYATGFIFNVLNDTHVRRLERSVTFRQFYYQEIGRHVDRLSLEEGRKLYEEVLSKAREEGKTIREYLGEGVRQRNRVSDKIERLGTRTEGKGTLTVRDLDDFARFVGLSRSKELLYDAANRGNAVDALRIVMPFAQAWKDVISTYAILGAQHNIHMVRQFARVYQGLERADPDQDGRGFLFRDPQTNEVQFHFPLSGSIAKLFTGIDAPLSAPLSRLSQGINYYPALGPYAQFAVSSFLPETPKYDEIKQLLLPYGETKLGDLAIGVFPGAIRKTAETLLADTENRVSTYGQVYLETLRALSVNPKYNDLRTEGDITLLLADAKSRARVLTGMRAVSQFLGPAAGVQEWKVPTDIGDKYVAVLLTELRKMQSEDYDTAIDRFLELYGDELMLYTSSKSKVLRDGVEATEAFGKWERENRDVMAAYQRVGAYFGPMGADYDFTVWERQLEEGSRERIGDRELIELAQLRVGSTRYRALRKMMPDYPNEKQRDVLAAYREQLHEEYPGFPIKAEFEVGKLPNQLDELRHAINDPRLSDNPIVPALKTYLAQRDLFESTMDGLSLKAKKKAGLRAQLFALGEMLASQNPEFDRIWSRVLSQEVE